MFQLWFFVISVCISVLAGLFSAFSPKLGMIIYVIFVIAALIMLVPSFCLTVRRLHDIGHSGWLVLLYVLPLLHLIPFIMTLLDSHPGENKYGPNPKGV
jgi:uncharacterized membrane protein YhaH (DUF805 family)